MTADERAQAVAAVREALDPFREVLDRTLALVERLTVRVEALEREQLHRADEDQDSSPLIH